MGCTQSAPYHVPHCSSHNENVMHFGLQPPPLLLHCTDSVANTCRTCSIHSQTRQSHKRSFKICHEWTYLSDFFTVKRFNSGNFCFFLLLFFSTWIWKKKYSRCLFYIPNRSTLRPVCGMVSIKVDVRLMFFPASWAQQDHMELERFLFFLVRSLLANKLSWKEPILWSEIFFSCKRDEKK